MPPDECAPLERELTGETSGDDDRRRLKKPPREDVDVRAGAGAGAGSLSFPKTGMLDV